MIRFLRSYSAYIIGFSALGSIHCAPQVNDTDTSDNPPVEGTEAACADEQDNDDDGLTDCADPDCDEAFECTWPDQIDHQTAVEFAGRTIECDAFGFPIDYDVDDCAVEFTASLAPIVTGNLCEPCDRTYQGSIDWIRETCNELLGNEGDLPTEATFGFRFISETSREVWGQNADQEWTKVADLGLEDGTWVSTTTSEIREDIEDCNNGVQYLGDLTITLSFTDAP